MTALTPNEAMQNIIENARDGQTSIDASSVRTDRRVEHAARLHVVADVPTRCDHCGATLVQENCPNYGFGEEHA